MSEVQVKKKRSRVIKFCLAAAAVSASVMMAVSPAFAEESTSPIDELKTETAKVGGIFDALVGPAVGSTVFAIGAVLVKRIAFS